MTRKTIAQLPEGDQHLVRLIRNLVIGLVASLLLLGAAITGTFLRGESTRSIVTRISECERDAESEACQVIREEGARAQSRTVACITIRQGGYPCPRPGSKAAKPEPVHGLNNGSGGEVGPVLGGSGGPSAPLDPGSNPAPTPPKGGSDPAHAPQEPNAPAVPPPPASASNPPPSATPTAPTETAPPPVTTPPVSIPPVNPPGLIPSTVEGVTGAVVPTVCAVAEVLRHLC